MLFCSVTPLPETDLSNVISVFEVQSQRLANLQGTGANERLSAYQDWASQASSHMRTVLDLPQVEHFIDTRRHDFLFNMFGGPKTLLNYSISAEQEDRARVFMAALAELRAVQASCEVMPQTLLIPDTNIYLHQDAKFQALDWHNIAGTTDEVRLLVPMAVVRELDRAKRAPGNKTVSFTNSEAVRDRARLTSKWIRTTFENPESVPEVSPGVTMELLMDPMGHRAIGDPDSEIIDRALALQTMAGGRNVSIVTSDGNMQFGAHVAGLGAILLPG